MRGFWPEEKVEAGHWSRRSPAYRLAKQWERRFFERADAIVSLTRAGVCVFPELGYRIPAATPVAVIPTCVDTGRFRPGPTDEALRRRLGLEGRLVIGCTGTLSGWYRRSGTLQFIARLARELPDAAALFVTREDHVGLRHDALAAGIPAGRLAITAAAFDAMPAHLRLMRLGVFFIAPSFSKRGSAATKLAEFLASGVPVVINDGVGDSGALVREQGAGVVLPELSERATADALIEVRALLADSACAARCRLAALRHFDLKEGVDAYLRVYHRLLTPEGAVMDAVTTGLDAMGEAAEVPAEVQR